jgi:hypothetical protein
VNKPGLFITVNQAGITSFVSGLLKPQACEVLADKQKVGTPAVIAATVAAQSSHDLIPSV